MLQVKKDDQIKITKIVKDYSIFFDINNQHYLLHKSENDGETIWTLYNRKLNNFGNYKLTTINSTYNINLSKIFSKRNIVYNQIDINYFIRMLSIAKLINSEIDYKHVILMKEYKNKIKNLEKEIRDIKSKIYN